MGRDSRSTVVVLPGLDGTGDLLDAFCAAAPPAVDCYLVRYPTDEPLDYRALEAYVTERIPPERRITIIAESFSGPIAVRLAARFGDRVKALVLCNSFVTPPRSRLLRLLARPMIFRIRLPERILAALMLAPLATPALTAAFASAIRRVHPTVLAIRVRELLSVDEIETIRRVTLPIAYLRGSLDRLVPERALRVLIEAVPAVHVFRIEAPHAILQTAPNAAWAAIHSLSND